MVLALIPTLLPQGEGLKVPSPCGRGTEGEDMVKTVMHIMNNQ